MLFEIFLSGVAIHCPGSTGHGSLLLPDTAGEKVNYVISKFMEFRQKEKNKLNSDPNVLLGDVTTINLTQLKVCILICRLCALLKEYVYDWKNI